MQRIQETQKQLLLSGDEVKELLESVKQTNCSEIIIKKIEDLAKKEKRVKYIPKKGVILDVAYRVKAEEWGTNPLEFKYRTRKVTHLRDHSKTLFTAVDPQSRYYLQLKKEEVFKFRYEAILFGLKRHLMVLEKYSKKLKSEKSLKTYNDKIESIKKEISKIEDNPAKILKMMARDGK